MWGVAGTQKIRLQPDFGKLERQSTDLVVGIRRALQFVYDQINVAQSARSEDWPLLFALVKPARRRPPVRRAKLPKVGHPDWLT
jgi:hypothetical protein